MVKLFSIGKKIREMRKEKKLTIYELAKSSGISKSYLSKIERAADPPPLSTLYNIAKALNSSVSDLLGEKPQGGMISHVRKNEREVITRGTSTSKYLYESIANKYPNRHSEPFILTIPKHRDKKLISQHDSEELIYVLSGTLKFQYGEKTIYAIEGDALYIDGNVPHIGESCDGDQCVCLCVMIAANVK